MSVSGITLLVLPYGNNHKHKDLRIKVPGLSRWLSH